MMTVEEAEKVLSSLKEDELIPIVSRLANRTPGTVYLPVNMAPKLGPHGEEGQSSMLAPAAAALVASLEGRLPAGENCEIRFRSLKHGAKSIGDWTVAVTHHPVLY